MEEQVASQQLQSVLGLLLSEGCWPPPAATATAPTAAPTAAAVQAMGPKELTALSPQSILEEHGRQAFERFAEVQRMQQEAARCDETQALLKRLLVELLSHGLSDEGTAIDEATLQAILDKG